MNAGATPAPTCGREGACRSPDSCRQPATQAVARRSEQAADRALESLQGWTTESGLAGGAADMTAYGGRATRRNHGPAGRGTPSDIRRLGEAAELAALSDNALRTIWGSLEVDPERPSRDCRSSSVREILDAGVLADALPVIATQSLSYNPRDAVSHRGGTVGWDACL